MRRGALSAASRAWRQTPTSMTSHGATTRLAMDVAARRLQLVLFHRWTCSAERCVSVLQETQAAHRTRMMPRGGVAGDTRRDAARHPHSHRAECCCRKARRAALLATSAAAARRSEVMTRGGASRAA
jgi:hypothetical protein